LRDAVIEAIDKKHPGSEIKKAVEQTEAGKKTFIVTIKTTDNVTVELTVSERGVVEQEKKLKEK
jgi:hypothetical protein